MRLSSVEVENWMAFRGVHRVDLPALPIAVVARYAADPRRSNWAGKTAFLEAIDWCLWGKHRKRLEDDVIFRDEAAVRVRVVFDDGTVAVRSRTRGKGFGFYVEIPGQPRVSKTAADDALERRLGMGWDDIRATTRAEQGDVEALVGAESGKRQATIRRWLRLDAWDRAAARARKAANLATEEALWIDAEIRRVEAEEERLAAELDADAPARTAEAVADLERALASVEAKRDALATSLIEVSALSRWDTLVADGKAAREAVKRAVAGLPGNEIEGAFRDELNAAAARLGELSAELTRFDAAVSGDWDALCPVSGSLCPVSGEVRLEVAGNRERLLTLRSGRDAAREQKANAERNLAAVLRARGDVEKAKTRLDALVAEARALKPRLDAWAASRGEAPESPAEVAKRLEAERAGVAAQIANTRRLLDEARVAERAVSDQIAKLSALAERVVSLRENHAATERRARALRIVARGLGPNGVPREIAEPRVALLERRACDLLEGTGLRVEVSWRRASQRLESECSECGHAYKGQRDKACPSCGVERAPEYTDAFELLVDDGSGVLEDVRAKSGGARALVGIAFRLAGGALLREMRGSPVTFAIIDEPLGALDAANRDRVAAQFRGMLSSTGLEQALVVSHDAAILDGFPVRVEVTRDESAGASRLGMA